MNKILNIKKNFLIVGRGATGIYLILKCLDKKPFTVIAPANVCYAAIYPVVYSNNKIKFVDVNKEDGNITLKIVKKNYDKNIKVLIAPHMYGNPIQEIQEIKKFCQQNQIVLIEDCAASMGAQINGIPVGSFGDYVIYSTGYSKILDVGNGGIIASDNPLDCERERYHKLPMFNNEIKNNIELFSKIYRVIRNNETTNLSTDIYKICFDRFKDNYLYKLPEAKEIEICNTLKKLESVVQYRKNQYNRYYNNIKFSNKIRPYSYYKGAVPWRFNIFVDKEIKSELINELLNRKLPVSDWYPVVSHIFGKKNIYENASLMENSILNFPLAIDNNIIDSICNYINYFGEGK